MKRFRQKLKLLSRKYKYDVSKKNVMIPPSEKRAPIKMAGYLEKRSKMKVVCRWKKLWFVLEGRLLTYYKSELEYLSLSPCRGTVNMGLAASVLPGASLEIVISTRSHTVSLRALNRSEHDVWLQALIDAMCLPNPGHNPCCTKPFHHYRYSTPESEVVSYTPHTKRSISGRANTLGHVSSLHGHSNTLSHSNNLSHSNTLGHANTLSSTTPLYVKTSPYPSYGTLPTRQQEARIDSRRGSFHSSSQDFSKDLKVDKISRKLSKVAISETSIPGKFKELKNSDSSVLRRSVSVEDEVNRYSENVYESLKDSDDKYNTTRNSKEVNVKRAGARINRSDSDCLMTMSRERILNNHRQFRSEQRTKHADTSPVRHTYETFSGRSSRAKNVNEKRSSATLEMNTRQRRSTQNLVPLTRRGVVRSDTDLSMCNRSRRHEIYGEGLSNSYDFALLQELIREKRRAPLPLPLPHTKRRSNSILRKFSRAGDTSYRPRERRLSVRKRSLSFLKKLVWKREAKWELGSRSSGYDTFDNRRRHYPEMQGPDSDMEIISDLSVMNLDFGFKTPRPEPPPDYDNVNLSESDDSEDGIPHLPPRYKKRSRNTNNSNYDRDSGVVMAPNSNSSKRSTSPWHDVPTNNQPVHAYEPKTITRSKEELMKADPPTLPRKTDKCKHIAQDVLFQDTDPGLKRLFSDSGSELGKRHDEIAEMLSKISDMAHQPLPTPSFTLYQNTLELFEERKRKNRKAQENGEDPDYDIPRPHSSLLAALQQNRQEADSQANSNFFSQYDDSLDATILKARGEDQLMAPDSLEYDPWSLSEDASSRDSWCTPHHLLKPQIIRPRHESLFQDSLNPPITLSDFMHLPHHGYIYG